VIGAVRPTGSCAPERRGEDHYEEEKKNARHFEPEDAAHPVKWAQKAANASHNSATCHCGGMSNRPTVCFLTRVSSVKSIRSSSLRACMCFGHLVATSQSLAHDSASNPKANSQRPADTLSSHFVMMVAAAVDESHFFHLCADRSCY